MTQEKGSMYMNIKMVSIFVDDPSAAFQFYTEVLGFQELLHVPEAYIAIVVSPEQPDGTSILLEPADDEIARPYRSALYERDLPCMMFGTTDIQADVQRLTERGVVFRGEPETNEYGTQVNFEDTFGNLIQLHQNPWTN
jgi:catechol 2,3-dioxygenase-like lactoylglutathione lyase family enzyme